MSLPEPIDDRTPRPARGVPRKSGLTLVLAATAIAGATGYIITWLVPRVVGFADYAGFAVFWSLLFLVVNALSGIQQEMTRATTPVVRDPDADTSISRARPAVFAVGAAVVVVAALASTAQLWGAAFDASSTALILPLTFGAASSVFVAMLTGTMYGVQRWVGIFWIVVIEAAVRLVAISIAVALTSDVVVLAWTVVIPFPIAFTVVWLVGRRALRGATRLDVGYRDLTWNVARTIVAAGSMGVLVSGFPFVLALTAGDVSSTLLGLVVAAATLVRAPLIVTAMALQSYLIVFFRERKLGILRPFVLIQAGILGLGLFLGVIGWLVGPAIFALLFPSQPVPDGLLIAVLVVSSSLLAGLTVSAAAVLSRARHTAYTAGWLVAAGATILVLLLPLDFVDRTMTALLVGPAAGLLVHTVALGRARA